MKRLLIILLFFGFTNSANAADLYKVDPTNASINWSANHFGFSNQSGKITDVSGTINLDEATPKNSAVDVEIGVTSLVTGLAKFDEHLKSADFLNTAKFPTAHFKSTSVIPSGKTLAKVQGTLTLLGVSKLITLDVRIVKIGINPINQKKTIGFYATTTLNRSDFGITFGTPGISNAVKIAIDLEANLVSDNKSDTTGAGPILSQNQSKITALPEWKIVPEKSKLEFKTIRDNSTLSGSFKKFDGQITFDISQLSKSKISIDVDTTSIDVSYSEANNTVRGVTWLSTKAFPNANFTSEKIVPLGDLNLINASKVNLTNNLDNTNLNNLNNVELNKNSDLNLKNLPQQNLMRAIGKLTIRGKTVPATIDFSLNKYSQTQASATGKLKIKRSTFGIGDRDAKKASGVQDDVEITFTLSAER